MSIAQFLNAWVYYISLTTLTVNETDFMNGVLYQSYKTV